MDRSRSSRPRPRLDGRSGWPVALAIAACSGQTAGTSGAIGAPVPADGPCTTMPGVTTLLPDYAYAIALQGGDIYLATQMGVLQVPAAGGPSKALTPDTEADALAIDATSAYYFSSHDVGTPDAQGKVSSGTALYSAPLAGGTPRILLDGVYAQEIATDGKWIWWTSAGVEGMPIGAATEPVKFPLESGALVEAIAVGGDSLFLAVYAIEPQGAGVAGVGSIRRAKKDGSAVTTIVNGLQHPTAIALDEDAVYFNEEGSAAGGLSRAGLDGSGQTKLAPVLTASLAVDGHAVYFATSDSIQKVPKTGGPVETVVSGLKSPGTLAIAGGNVYWVDGTSVALSDPAPGYAVMTTCK